MKKVLIIFVLLLAGVVIFFASKKTAPAPVKESQDIKAPIAEDVSVSVGSSIEFEALLDRVKERVSKKPFGILINPQTSPVQPENFSGYHTGVDFEIFPEELRIDVSVMAVCSGEIKMKKFATGYGGVLIEECLLEGSPITVVYGHLKLDSISKNVGNELLTGEKIGILGTDKSVETSGERKHLHLGFHKGEDLNILGYVQNESKLSDWLDSCLYVCR